LRVFTLVAFLVMTAMVAAAILQRIRTPQASHDEALREEALAALNGARVGQGRFSGFRYAPSTSILRSRNAPPTRSPDATIALARLEKAMNESRSAALLHGLGVGLATEGRFDEAINNLAASAASTPGAAVWTDLAAAYLARSRPDDWSGASDAAARALAIDPNATAALFNRALALERLHLDREAVNEWRHYLRIDQSSPWAVEAREHLQSVSDESERGDWQREEPVLRTALRVPNREIVDRTVARFPQQTRELIADTLLPEWAAKAHPPNEDRSAALADCRLLAEAVARHGDQLMLDSVRAVETAPLVAVQSLADGYAAFARGRAASGSYRYDEADRELAYAELKIEGRSPLALWNGMLRAIVLFQRSDFNQSRSRLRAIRGSVVGRHYPALLGQIDWTLGVISAGQGDFAEAFANYRHALDALETIGEIENIASVQSLLAETTRVLGDTKGSWALQIDALSHLSQLRRPQRKQSVVMMAGQASMRQDRPLAALDFQNRFLEAAREMASPTAIAEALIYRARVYRRVGDAARAVQDLDAARTMLATSREAAASFLKAQIQLEDAQTSTIPGGDQAILDGLNDALTYFRSSSRSAWLPRVYLARARLLIARRESLRAAADLSAGIESLEAQRKTVSSETLRMSYLDEVWDLFEEMIALQLDLGRRDDAFAFSERSRARSILDAVDPVNQPPVPSRVAALLPSQAVMLYFMFARQHAVVWVLAAGQSRFVELAATSDSIEQHARRFRQAFETRRGDADAAGAALWSEIFAPIVPLIPDHATIVIVPDRSLHQVPFAALRQQQGDYLIARHALVTAPSARTFLRNASLLSSRPGDKKTALVFGNPSTPTDDLPPLPGAEREAAEVADLYANAVKLVGDAATRSRFLNDAPNYEVVHIAAHATANEEFPDLSRLFLAPDADGSGAVMATDLGRLRFSRTRLVVLAACGTAAGATFRGEGVVSLTRPFLAGGVPQVVGTLWEIDDQTSRKLFAAFHRGYASGVPAALALQQAQLAVIRDPTAPSTNWAAVTLLGTVATFESFRNPVDGMGTSPTLRTTRRDNE